KHEPADNRLCPECKHLLDYAKNKLTNCPFAPHKGPCSKCSIHCYKPEYRTRIIEVMRYSGPRMLTRHPVLAVDHLLSGRRKQKKTTQDHIK
ncbi:MAG: nitrous oxide-stimulated promoter family protein, partial [Planctomycetota bacterium]